MGKSGLDISFVHNLELVEESAERETGTNTYELPMKVATDLHEVSSGINTLLQELTSVRYCALDESTDMGSLASGSGIGSDISAIHYPEADMGNTSTDCMGRGRGCIRSRQTVPAIDEEAVGNKLADRSCQTPRKPAWVTRARKELETELECRLRSSFRNLLESVT